MKYRVIGQNRDTGARMILEFEAESKAAAERKASQQGMSVNRVEDITDGHVSHAYDAPLRRRKGAGGKILMFILLLVLVVAILWMLNIIKLPLQR
jgi:uncharacterized membrane protein YcjF (UPF0283 family)